MTQAVATFKQIDAQDTELVRIIQLTDSHIFADDEGALLGLNTRESFEAVLQRVGKEELSPDLYLATGDLSQDASESAYLYFQGKMNSLNKPCFWIPGNHDNPQQMASSLNQGNMHPHKRVLIGNWQIVMLNSAVPQKVHGHFEPQELELVVQAMTEFPDRHLLVCMHHQPVNMGSEWLDNLGIRNAGELFDCVKNHAAKVCFLWGHVHQDFQGEHQGVQLISTPSTCVQFKPGSKEFAAGEEAPGYRYLSLYNDGTVESVMHRVYDFELSVDYSIKGY